MNKAYELKVYKSITYKYKPEMEYRFTNISVSLIFHPCHEPFNKCNLPKVFHEVFCD